MNQMNKSFITLINIPMVHAIAYIISTVPLCAPAVPIKNFNT